MEAELRIFDRQPGDNAGQGPAEPGRPGPNPELADRTVCESAHLLVRVLKLNVEAVKPRRPASSVSANSVRIAS